jgi:hypothetical protein
VGFFDFLLGSAIFILLTLFVPERNYGYRLTRLPSTIFTSFGAMQFYSAIRGFCSQVWGRASRQIQSWELDALSGGDDDEEAVTGGREMEEVESLPLTTLNGSGLGLGLAGLDQDDGDKEEWGGIDGKTEELDMTLPDCVYPLGALVGLDIDSLPSEAAFNLPPTSPSQRPSQPRKRSDESPRSGSIDDFSEAQLRQLAIRRSTIKVPASDLAFPIFDSATSPITPPSGQPLFGYSSVSPRPKVFDNDISPFAQDSKSHTETMAMSPISPAETGVESAATSPKPTPDTTIPSTPFKRTAKQIKRRSASNSVLSQHRIPADLSTLLVNFRRAEPLDPCLYREGQAQRDKSTRVFGPERLIEDPRVKRLMKRIVNEILGVGAVFGILTMVLCFAVPMRLSA